MPSFVLAKVGFDHFLKNFRDLYGQIFRFLAKKSGLLPVFENQKWAEKFGCIF
nr:MAG TPA: hypothetical protein [Caudoviricetes sp.]DAZ09108.1 MAG TPA: hypothetical protein [Caudoviricetes sp.]